MFTAELQRRLPPGSGVLCFSLHPGEVHTNIVRSLPWPVRRLYAAIMPRILFTPAQGTRLTSAQSLLWCPCQECHCTLC